MPARDPNFGSPGPVRADDAAWGCFWWWWLWLIILIIIFGGWGWWGGWWGGYGRRAGPDQTQADNSYPEVTSPAPPEFTGRTITVTGQVAQVLQPRAFTLQAAPGGRSLLVVENQSATSQPPVRHGETVRVTGTVEQFNGNDLQGSSSEAYSQYVNRPAIMATSVAPESGTGRASGATAPRPPSGNHAPAAGKGTPPPATVTETSTPHRAGK
jgi:hypothetical protein